MSNRFELHHFGDKTDRGWGYMAKIRYGWCLIKPQIEFFKIMSAAMK